MKKAVTIRNGLLAISPIIIFLLLYLLTSLLIGDFYKMPISVAMLVASIWAVFTLKNKPLGERIEIFSKDAGNHNVMYMVWIFILAGAFAAIARYTGAVEATVELTMSLLPSYMIIPGLFVATCFISMAIGTSVGTVVALTPLAVEMTVDDPVLLPYFVAIVLGGAFFGDNLSFISDTTIAATRTQGCNMKDKFFANIWIVLPAALITLILYCVNAPDVALAVHDSGKSPFLVIPYLVVIVCAVAGINVTIVLLAGIISALIAGLLQGTSLIDLSTIGGEGIASVGDLIIITLLAAGMLGVIKASGGIDFLLKVIGRNIKSSKGAQFTIVSLVGVVNLCTANNTVAIITVGSMTKKIASVFHISPRRSASLLDTGSCIVQALIPYGAQTLMASSLSGISPIASWRYLFYPQVLTGVLIIAILITHRRYKKKQKERL